MMTSPHRRLSVSYSVVVSTLALVIALSAGAYAAGLAKNAVRSQHIADGQVRTADLGKGAVTTAKVNLGSLGKVMVRSDRVMHGSRANVSGPTPTLFGWPAAGWELRMDGDTNAGDLGVQVVTSRDDGSIEVISAETAAVVGVPFPAFPVQPSSPTFFIVDGSERSRTALITCASAGDEEAMVTCVGHRAR